MQFRITLNFNYKLTKLLQNINCRASYKILVKFNLSIFFSITEVIQNFNHVINFDWNLIDGLLYSPYTTIASLLREKDEPLKIVHWARHQVIQRITWWCIDNTLLSYQNIISNSRSQGVYIWFLWMCVVLCSALLKIATHFLYFTLVVVVNL